jgi:hypothetical protein
MHLTLHYPLPPSLTGKTNHHPGNIKWRLIVEEKKDEYMACTRAGKPIFAMEVVRTWRGLSPPGRFLRKEEKTGLWIDIGDDDARNKCSQLLREKNVSKLRLTDDGQSDKDKESLAAVVSVAKKGDAATSKRAFEKINPNVDGDDSVFNDSGTSKGVVTQKQKKARTLPPGINLTGRGTFVSVMLFQIMLSDFMSCLTYWSFLFDSSVLLLPSIHAHS